LATWLDNAGYTTAYMGKFMNGYDSSEAIPNGWDRWWGYTRAYYDLHEPGWQVNANGEIRTIPYPEYRVDADYLATLTAQARALAQQDAT
jgi:N-acetylglucosamine-6-sulfatase